MLKLTLFISLALSLSPINLFAVSKAEYREALTTFGWSDTQPMDLATLKKLRNSLLKNLHPDKNSQENEAHSRRETQKINAAYEIILSYLKSGEPISFSLSSPFSYQILSEIMTQKSTPDTLLILLDREDFTELADAINEVSKTPGSLSIEALFAKLLPSYSPNVSRSIPTNRNTKVLDFLLTYYSKFPSQEGLLFVWKLQSRAQAPLFYLDQTTIKGSHYIFALNSIASILEEYVPAPAHSNLRKKAYLCSGILVNGLSNLRVRK